MTTCQIIHGDCLEVMPGLEDQSVDMILTDLPYQITSCHWDRMIDLDLLWAQYKRLIKQHGAIVLTASQPFTSKLVMSNLAMFKYEWIWHKTVASDFLNANRRPMRDHESVLVFANGQTIYNPIMRVGKVHERGGSSSGSSRGSDNYGKFDDKLYHSNEYYPRTVFQVKVDKDRNVSRQHRPNKEQRHPTQKPVALFEYLIRTYTEPGDLILDSCLGSGTTAVAALNTGRRVIGIEKEAEYIEIAKRRVERETRQGNLF